MVEVIRYTATGRRKTSIARVNLMPGTGLMKVNHRGFEEYFPRETDRIDVLEPLQVTHNFGKFDVFANIVGGGKTGQAGALKLAIARSLAKVDTENKSILKKANCLRRDPRMKERKKPGQKGARRKFQWVKR